MWTPKVTHRPPSYSDEPQFQAEIVCPAGGGKSDLNKQGPPLKGSVAMEPINPAQCPRASRSRAGVKVAGDTSSTTELHNKLDAEKQADFNKVVIERLMTLIGGCAELPILAEYVAAMLQSSRPPEQIQSSLEAFLQDRSAAFTKWLFQQLTKYGKLKDSTGSA